MNPVSTLVRLPPSQACFKSLLCILLVAANAVAVADEPVKSSAEATAKAKALIEGLLKERKRLVSGIVSVRGSQVTNSTDPPPVRPIRQMYAFDHAQGKLRFDSSKVTYVRSLNPANVAAAGNNLKIAMKVAEGEVVNTLLRYVRTRDYSASWDKVINNSYISLHVRPANGQMGGSIASRHHLIDLRGCGLMSQQQFQSGDFEQGKTVADFCNTLLTLPVVSVTEKDGLSVVAMHTDHVDYELVIDVKRQFCPVAYTIKGWKGGGNSSDHVHSSRVEWHEISGVMVPISYSIEFKLPDENINDRCRFAYDWDCVNEPIDNDFFSFCSFPDIPVNTKVVDARAKDIGEWITVGVWTDAGYVGPRFEFAAAVDDPSPIPIDYDDSSIMRSGGRAGQERDDNGLKMKLVWCPLGKFTMGSPNSERDRFKTEDQVEVELSRGFWLGKYEVTQAQWKQLGQPPLWNGETSVKEGDDYPATYLNFGQARAFCEQLTRQERAAGRLPHSWQYILPTEAQWEYACRAGTTTRYSFGDDESLLDEFAWTGSNTKRQNEPYAHPVGLKKSNPFGLHDMHGDVWEWCRDGWQRELPGGKDPLAIASDPHRVIRGGSWFDSTARLCRSAMRNTHHATSSAGFSGELGFRVALCPVE